MKTPNRILLHAALLMAISGSANAAGWSTPAAKVTFYQFIANTLWIQLDPSVTITTPNSACMSWGNWASFPAVPLTDYSKAWLTTAQPAVAAGHKVQIYSDTCNTGYPELKGRDA